MKSEVSKPLQKPWAISLGQRWIREDHDQSKLINFFKMKDILVYARVLVYIFE